VKWAMTSGSSLVIVNQNLKPVVKTGVTAERDKIMFRLFNSNPIFNITLREELLSSPKQNQSWLFVLFSGRHENRTKSHD